MRHPPNDTPTTHKNRHSLRIATYACASLIACASLTPACSTSPDLAAASEQDPGSVLSTDQGPLDPAYPTGTTSLTFTYDTTDQNQKAVPSSGLLLIPPGTAPPGGWPIVAWDHGTTGLGDDCAPSRKPGAWYPQPLGEFLRNGYAVVATDYVGLGTSGIHPYLIADSAGRATIDSVRAALQIDDTLASTWVSVGHSQGGQASWATNELAASYGSGLDYRGGVALAPVAPLSTEIDQLASSSDPVFQAYYAMVLVGLRTQHEFDYSDYLGELAQSTLPSVESLCGYDLLNYFTSRNLPGDQFAFRSPDARERLINWLVQYEITRTQLSAPLLVLHGTADQDTPIEGSEKAIAAARRLGGTVDFTQYPGVTHDEIVNAGLPQTLMWLKEVGK